MSGYTLPGDRDLRGPGRFLWWLVISQRWRVLLGAVLGTAWMIGLVLPPYVLSLAIDDGLQPRRFSSLAGWVLAHRLHTAHDADRVAVMEDGRLTELGTHDDLVASGGAYARLWNSWHGDHGEMMPLT